MSPKHPGQKARLRIRHQHSQMNVNTQNSTNLLWWQRESHQTTEEAGEQENKTRLPAI